MPGRHSSESISARPAPPSAGQQRRTFTDLDTDLELDDDEPEVQEPPGPPSAYIVISLPRLSLTAPAWLRTLARRTGLTAALRQSRTHPPRPGVVATAILGI